MYACIVVVIELYHPAYLVCVSRVSCCKSVQCISNYVVKIPFACCKFAHFLISTIAKEILNMYCRHGGIIDQKNAHAPSEVVGRASEVAGGPFKFVTSVLYILFF